MGPSTNPASTSPPCELPQQKKDPFAGETFVRIRKLVRNLPTKTVIRRVHESERLAAAGERELGFYLREVQRRKLYREVSCTSFDHFVRLRTGISEKKARELVGIARALEKLPVIDNAFSDGLLYWTAVRAMVTVAIPQDEQEWVDFARMNTVRAVERRVASSKAGDGPREKPFGGSPTFYPHEFNASPELHQLIDCVFPPGSPQGDRGTGGDSGRPASRDGSGAQGR